MTATQIGLAILGAIAIPGVVVLIVVAAKELQRRLDARYRAATTDVVGEDDERVRAAFAAVDAEEARLLREFDEAVAIAEAGAVGCGIDCDPMRLDNQWEIYAEDFEASATSGEEATA